MCVSQKETLDRVLGHSNTSRSDKEEQPDKAPKPEDWLVRQKNNKKDKTRQPLDLKAWTWTSLVTQTRAVYSQWWGWKRDWHKTRRMAGEGGATTATRGDSFRQGFLTFATEKEQRKEWTGLLWDVSSKARFCRSGCLFCFQDGRSQSGERCPTESATKMLQSLYPHCPIQ